jgi:nucleoside-triphosphatase THEP1
VQEYPEWSASLLSKRPLLASIFSEEEKAPKLVLVTGDSGSGKTDWCLELIDKARQNGIRVSGLVSPPVLDAGQKVGIDLMDASTDERRRLAVFRQNAKQKSANEPGISTLNWTFDPGVLAWGNQLLDRLGASELLVLDELGPLELLENKGLTAGLKCIDAQHYKIACVVIRPSLLPTVLERWPWGKVLRVVNRSTKDVSK